MEDLTDGKPKLAQLDYGQQLPQHDRSYSAVTSQRRANGGADEHEPQFSNAALSVYLVILIDAVLVLVSPERFLHWFMVPVGACGALIGIDALRWARGQTDLLDPVGIVGVYGVHFFFLAPLLHVALNYWMSDVVAPPDWRDWLGWMAVVNVISLSAYRLGVGIRDNPTEVQRPRSTVVVKPKQFKLASVAALAVGIAIQLFEYLRVGGVAGYIAAARGTAETSLKGMGTFFTISESVPIIAIIAYVVFARERPGLRSLRVTTFALGLFFVLAIFFGGLRGSRSTTVWSLLIAVGAIHFYLRPLSRRYLLVGAIAVFSFMYIYGFFKWQGVSGVDQFLNGGTRAAAVQASGRGIDTLLLGDLGRSDVQAYLLYRTTGGRSDYQFAMGMTYVHDLAILLPRAVMPDRPPTKVKQGTEALYGMGSYRPGFWSASRVYGLAGEAMLNFSFVAVPLAYLCFGILVGRVSNFVERLGAQDTRRLVSGVLLTTCLVVLIGDSDNIIVFAMKSLAVPAAVVWAGSVVIEARPTGTAKA